MSTTSSPVPPSSGRFDADAQGWFGGPEQGWGGRFMPEALIAALDELTEAWTGAMADPAFVGEFEHVLRDYAGLPSPLFHARRLSALHVADGAIHLTADPAAAAQEASLSAARSRSRGVHATVSGILGPLMSRS